MNICKKNFFIPPEIEKVDEDWDAQQCECPQKSRKKEVHVLLQMAVRKSNQKSGMQEVL